MKTEASWLFAFTLFTRLCILVQAAPPIAVPSADDDEPKDPFQMRVSQSKISMIFGGFSNPYTHFNPLQLPDIAQKAQSEIVKEVAKNHGDGRLVQPNFQWCSAHGTRPLCLRVNHQLDDRMT
ncbi:MAG: hypothetical protein Q9181_003967 [Wetmoreana brouardii]